MSPQVLAIDIGGSSVKVCQAYVTPDSIDWQPSYAKQIPIASMDALRNEVHSIVSSSWPFDAIGISTAGSVDLEGQVIRAGYFEGYERIYWRDELRQMGIEVPVSVLNDGQAATYAEFEARSERGLRTSIHFVVGTGIGGGAVVDRKLVRGERGFAGAFGHIKVVSGPDALPCRCGSSGCVQTLASAQRIASRLETTLIQTRTKKDLGHPGSYFLQNLSELSDSELSALRAIMADAGYWLGRAIGTAVNVFNPAIVTVGGGIVQADDELASAGSVIGPLLDAAFAEGQASAIGAARQTASFAAGALGNEAGIRGAGLMAARLLEVHVAE